MNNRSITDYLPPMLTGDNLLDKLKVEPSYNHAIRNMTVAERLLHLNDIYDCYYPGQMAVEIYTKIYLAMIRSLQKKESCMAMTMRNNNAKILKNGIMPIAGGGITGQDVFSIIGPSGIGKSTAIERSIAGIEGKKVIEMDSPYCKLIPILSVQCPYDCSAKTLLLDINRKIDMALGTDYYDMQIRARASTNHMVISTAQVLLNHVAVLVIDEVQNLIKHRAGNQLIALLTELLNESGIAIVTVGTPEVEPFFSAIDYLARRMMGLRYERYEYDDTFRDFCKQIWTYQYTASEVQLNEGFINYLYQHSSGVLAHVIFLFATAQEFAILNGSEKLSIQNLDEAYARMHTLHNTINPEMDLKKRAKNSRKIKTSEQALGEMKNRTDPSVDAWNRTDFSFQKICRLVKTGDINIEEMVQKNISVTELEV